MANPILAETSNKVNQSEVNLDAELLRARYDSKAARENVGVSSKYDFDIQLCFDNQDNPAYQLTITRKSDSATIHQCYYYSTEDVDDAASSWKVQLGLGAINTAMWGGK